MLGDFFILGLNNLKRRKLRSWLTMIGIFIGIAAVVALISLGTGLRYAITGQFASMGTDYLTVQSAETGFGPPGSTAIEKLTEHDLELIRGVRGVESATPILLKNGRVEYNDVVVFAITRSVPEDNDARENFYEEQSMSTETGRLLREGDSGKAVLGNNYLHEDKFGKKLSLGKKILVEGEEFEVIGFLEGSGAIMMNGAVLIFHEEIKEIFNIDDEIDLIGVNVEDSENAEEVASRIEKAMRKDRNQKIGEEDFTVQTPLQTIQTVDTILLAINIIVVGIALISLIVGGIGIANTMYTSVVERTKEIGTMKAIGARNSDILSIFLIESGLLGLVGGFVGTVIGLLISYGVSYGANIAFGSEIIAFSISLPLVLFAISFAFFIGMISGIIPSIQASKLKPADALRG